MNRMKTGLLLMLCAFAAVLACACAGRQKVNNAAVYKVFYPNQDFTEIGSEDIEALSADTAGDVSALITALESTPEDVKLKAVLGSSVTFSDYTVSGGNLTMNFGTDYKNMSKSEEVLFRASVVQTLTQVKGVNFVTFDVDGEPLLDDNGEAVGVMMADSFIDDTGTEINAYSKAKLRLYFTDREGKHLIATDEDAVYSSNMSLEKLVVEKLIEGPDDSTQVYPTIAPDTKLLGVTVKDGICYVNFDATLADKPYDVREDVVIYSIVDSLSELGTVNRVQISIEGKTDRMLFEKMSLDTIYGRDLDLVTLDNADGD